MIPFVGLLLKSARAALPYNETEHESRFLYFAFGDSAFAVSWCFAFTFLLHVLITVVLGGVYLNLSTSLEVFRLANLLLVGLLELILAILAMVNHVRGGTLRSPRFVEFCWTMLSLLWILGGLQTVNRHQVLCTSKTIYRSSGNSTAEVSTCVASSIEGRSWVALAPLFIQSPRIHIVAALIAFDFIFVRFVPRFVFFSEPSMYVHPQDGVSLVWSVMCLLFLLAREASRRQRYQHKEAVLERTMTARSSRTNVNLMLDTMLPESIIPRLLRQEPIVDTSVASVLTSDIGGFTEWSGSRRAAQIVKMLNDMYFEFDAAAERHFVSKITTVGDAYIAVCGLPHPDAIHAYRMCSFASEMLDIVCRDVKPQFPDVKGLRVGISSGEVCGGLVGESLMSYQVFGHVVDESERMEQLAPLDAICITATTMRMLEQECYMSTLVGVAFIDGPVPASFVVGGKVRLDQGEVGGGTRRPGSRASSIAREDERGSRLSRSTTQSRKRETQYMKQERRRLALLNAFTRKMHPMSNPNHASALPPGANPLGDKGVVGTLTAVNARSDGTITGPLETSLEASLEAMALCMDIEDLRQCVSLRRYRHVVLSFERDDVEQRYRHAAKTTFRHNMTFVCAAQVIFLLIGNVILWSYAGASHGPGPYVLFATGLLFALVVWAIRDRIPSLLWTPASTLLYYWFMSALLSDETSYLLNSDYIYCFTFFGIVFASCGLPPGASWIVSVGYGLLFYLSPLILFHLLTRHFFLSLVSEYLPGYLVLWSVGFYRFETGERAAFLDVMVAELADGVTHLELQHLTNILHRALPPFVVPEVVAWFQAISKHRNVAAAAADQTTLRSHALPSQSDPRLESEESESDSVALRDRRGGGATRHSGGAPLSGRHENRRGRRPSVTASADQEAADDPGRPSERLAVMVCHDISQISVMFMHVSIPDVVTFMRWEEAMLAARDALFLQRQDISGYRSTGADDRQGGDATILSPSAPRTAAAWRVRREEAGGDTLIGGGSNVRVAGGGSPPSRDTAGSPLSGALRTSSSFASAGGSDTSSGSFNSMSTSAARVGGGDGGTVGFRRPQAHYDSVELHLRRASTFTALCDREIADRFSSRLCRIKNIGDTVLVAGGVRSIASSTTTSPTVSTDVESNQGGVAARPSVAAASEMTSSNNLLTSFGDARRVVVPQRDTEDDLMEMVTFALRIRELCTMKPIAVRNAAADPLSVDTAAGYVKPAASAFLSTSPNCSAGAYPAKNGAPTSLERVASIGTKAASSTTTASEDGCLPDTSAIAVLAVPPFQINNNVNGGSLMMSSSTDDGSDHTGPPIGVGIGHHPHGSGSGTQAAAAAIRVTCGVHVGPVVGGILGQERLMYDIFGDTVNVASRVLSTSPRDRHGLFLSDEAKCLLIAWSQRRGGETNPSSPHLHHHTSGSPQEHLAHDDLSVPSPPLGVAMKPDVADGGCDVLDAKRGWWLAQPEKRILKGRGERNVFELVAAANRSTMPDGRS